MEVMKKGGVTYINVTPHPVVFRRENGEEFTVPPSGVVINARPVEEPAGERSGVRLVRTRFVADPSSATKLDELESRYPGAVIFGSIIAAEAFPGRVLALIAAPGYERVPVAEKRMRPDKFTTF